MGTYSKTPSLLLRALPWAVFLVLCLLPVLSFGADGFGGTLENIRDKITGTILPALSVIGVSIAGVSFFTGNPNAKQHVTYAILGCIFSFGASQIVALIRSTIH